MRAVAHTPVLVVDLNRPKFLVLPWFMQEAGFDVSEAHSVEDAEDRLSSPNPARVIVMNTVATGRQLVEAVVRMRLRAPNMRVLVMGLGSHGERVTPRADLCLHSPMDVDDVIDAARGLSEN